MEDAEIVERAKNSNLNDLVSELIPLAKYSIKSWFSSNQFLEIKCEAFWLLFKAVRKIKEEDHRNAKAYIVRTIKKGVLKFVMTNSGTIKVSDVTQWRNQKKNNFTIKIFSINDYDVTCVDNMEFEIRDFINHADLSKGELEVLDLRLKGYDNLEISKMINVNVPAIQKRMRILCLKLKTKWTKLQS